jgi:hypothetical protein
VRLYTVIGSLLYQRGAFAHLPNKVEALRAHGIEVVVCLWRQADPDLRGVVDYVHFPLSDGKDPQPERAGEVARLVAAGLRHARPTLVHCQGGRNRAGLVNALVLREYLGITGAEAAARVRRARPGALANEHFYHYLQGLGGPDGRRMDQG